MTNELCEQVALFRYGLISPLLNNQVTSKKDYLSEICGKIHDAPYYGRKSFAPKTIESWLRDYRRGGFTALKPKGRSDKGSCRALTPEENEQLVIDAILTPDNVSYHTIYRLLKINNLLERDSLPKTGKKRSMVPILSATALLQICSRKISLCQLSALFWGIKIQKLLKFIFLSTQKNFISACCLCLLSFLPITKRGLNHEQAIFQVPFCGGNVSLLR